MEQMIGNEFIINAQVSAVNGDMLVIQNVILTSQQQLQQHRTRKPSLTWSPQVNQAWKVPCLSVYPNMQYIAN